MADASEWNEGLMLFAEDFDTLIEIIETNDDETDQHFSAAVNETQSQEVVCAICGKKCKSKAGLKRHKTAKHNQSQARGQETQKQKFTPSMLAGCVNVAIEKLKGSKIYSSSIRSELTNYCFEELEQGSEEFQQLRNMYEGLVKNGDIEKCYGKFYAAVPLNSKSFFKGLLQPAATLLSTKVADCILVQYQKEKSNAEKNEAIPTSKLSEREISGLQYLGGYVLHNLHKKHAQKNSKGSQQAMAILKAAKKDDSDQQQKLVSALNRGGLWSISASAEKMFTKVEQNFRTVTAKCDTHKLDIATIANKSISDSDVVSNYKTILSVAELVPDNQVCKDTFDSIISLYVRVRSFSFAKDIIQKFKVKAKQTKSKALRKEIGRSCEKGVHTRPE